MKQGINDRILWGIVFFGIALMLAGIVYFILRHPNEGFFYFGVGFILFCLFGLVPNRIVIMTDGILMSAFFRKKYLAYEEIEHMEWKCTGKLITSNYTGYLYMKKGYRRKILCRDEETLKVLNDIVMRAVAVGHSDRAGEILYLR